MNVKLLLVKTGIIFSIVIGSILVLLGLISIILYISAPKMVKPKREIKNSHELDQYLQLITKNNTPPAISVSVFKNGSSVYEKAFGYLDPDKIKQADVNTGFAWWSATKLFTATAVFQLVERYDFDIDRKVSDYLEYFHPVDKNGNSYDITIRHLLMHQSGLPSMVPDLLSWLRFQDEAPVNQSEFYKKKYPGYSTLNFKPGTKSKYTNNAYLALGAVIETVTGISYEDYVAENILVPLGMNKSGFVRTPEMLSNFAEPSTALISIYTPLVILIIKDWFDKYVTKTVHGRTWMKKIYTLYTPSTGLNGPAHDLSKIGIVLLNKGEQNGIRILSKDNVDLMLNIFPEGEPGKKNNPQLGLGWKRWKEKGVTFIGHAGGGPGYGAQLAVIPEKNIVISFVGNDGDLNKRVLLNTIAGIDW